MLVKRPFTVDSGADQLSDADLDRLEAYGDNAQKWNEAALPPVQAILDVSVSAEDAATVIDAATPTLTRLLATFVAVTVAIEDRELAEVLGDLTSNYQDKLETLRALSADWWAGGDGTVALSELERLGAEALQINEELVDALDESFDREGFDEEMERRRAELFEQLGIPVP